MHFIAPVHQSGPDTRVSLDVAVIQVGQNLTLIILLLSSGDLPCLLRLQVRRVSGDAGVGVYIEAG